MCGIFFTEATNYNSENIQLLQKRGPDASRKIEYEKMTWFFFRLAIQDTSNWGMQPWETEDYIFMANGEIYNSTTLRSHFKPTCFKSRSDCEVIPHLIMRFGPTVTLSMIEGVFAWVFYNKKTKQLLIARDALGIKSLYMGRTSSALPLASNVSESNGKNITVSSELKAFSADDSAISQFPAGHFYDSLTQTLTQWHSLTWSPRTHPSLSNSVNPLSLGRLVRQHLKRATLRRLETSDREVGCFLSGGLDSSIVAALAQQEAQKAGVRLKTFSVGMKGATDLKAARKVATWINSDHYEVVFSEKDMLDAIPRVIKRIESYDITTVRASTGMVLLSDYIRTNTQVKVVFSGEGADELSASYRYFRNAPSPQALQDESVRLVQDLQYFDILRCDKSVSGSGLEARTPFFDMQWVDWYMCLPPALKSSQHQIEKKIIRDAFHQTGLLPQEILQRGKEAFSDGCSSMKKPWFKIIQDHCEQLISDKEFEEKSRYFDHLPPKTKEAYWYRSIFEKFYPGRAKVVPYMWLPKWTTEKDPSARLL